MTEDPLPLPPGTTKVDITVGGHTIIVESPDPLDVVAGKALELFRATAEDARRIPTGFTTTGGSVERDPYAYSDSADRRR